MEKFHTVTNTYGSINVDEKIVSSLIKDVIINEKGFEYGSFHLSKNSDGYYELEVFLKNKFTSDNSKNLQQLHKNLELTFKQALDLRNIMIFINIAV